MSKSPYAWGTEPQETASELYGAWVDFCHLINLIGNLPDTRDPTNYESMRPLEDYASVILFWLGFNVDDVDMLAAEDTAWRVPLEVFTHLSDLPPTRSIAYYKALYQRVKVRLKTLAWKTGALNDLRRYLDENLDDAGKVSSCLRLIFRHSLQERLSEQV